MPRSKQKTYFTIRISQEKIESVPGETPPNEKFVTRMIYEQTVERINLKAVIAAVNGEKA